MRKFLTALLLAIIIVWPSCAAAADFKLNISIARLEDGTTRGELWYGDKVVWRVELLADGAAPALSARPGTTTLVIPDIVDGMLLLKVHTN